MTCNDWTCRVCNVDRKRLCHNELASRPKKLTPLHRIKTGGTRQLKITTNLDSWFSEDDLKQYRKHRMVRGFRKSGRTNRKVS